MNLIKKLILAGCCAVALGACKKEENGPSDILSYNVNGVLKSAKPDAYYYSDHSVMIDGGDGSDDMVIFINANLGIGTFHIGQLQDDVGATYVNYDNPINFDSDTGTLTITLLTENHISGTFNFKAVSGPFSRQITKGYFNTTMSAGPPPADTTNYNESTAIAARAAQMRRLKLRQ